MIQPARVAAMQYRNQELNLRPRIVIMTSATPLIALEHIEVQDGSPVAMVKTHLVITKTMPMEWE